MLRLTCARRYLHVLRHITKPPIAGYEIAELPNEKIMRDFVAHHKDKLVVSVVHSGGYARLSDDPQTGCFVSTLNLQNYGDPSMVRFCLVPGTHAPKLVDEQNIITFPTALLYYGGDCFERVVGARGRELSIKCLFKLRTEGHPIFVR